MTEYDNACMAHATEEVRGTYGRVVNVKPKTLLKFGRNDTVGTSLETVWNQSGDETYVSSNLITGISSSDDGDTQPVVVEGHTVNGDGDFDFVVQTISLTGQTTATLATPLARCSRLANLGSTDFAGDIYVYQDDTVTSGVPQTATKIHAKALAGENQTFKAATTLSRRDFLFVTHFYADVNEKTSASVDFRFEIRRKGGVFRPAFSRTASSGGGGIDFVIEPHLIVPANADVRVRGFANTTNVSISAGWNSFLALAED